MASDLRPYPELLSDDEKKSLLKEAEILWAELQDNNLGGFSGKNRPFHIMYIFRTIIEKYSNRDTGLQWSPNALKDHPDHGQKPHDLTMLKVEIAPGIEVFMTIEQRAAWEAHKK